MSCLPKKLILGGELLCGGRAGVAALVQRAQRVPPRLLRQFEVNNNNTNHWKLKRLFLVQRAQLVPPRFLRQFEVNSNVNHHGKLIRLFLVQPAQLALPRLRQF